MPRDYNPYFIFFDELNSMQIIGERLKKTPITQLPTPLYDAIIHKQLDNFTLAECYKSVYGDEVAQLHCHVKYSKIYYHINKLVKKGLLIKYISGNVSRAIYLKSSIFDEMIQEHLSEKQQQSPLPMDFPLSKFQERYSKYENEIQELLGEWREYDDLLNECPRLVPIISKSIERVNKDINNTIGKMRAVKKLIDSVTT